MTNQEILQGLAVSIWGEKAVENMINNGKDIPLHTVKHWQKMNFAIKRGEKGIETRLWRRRKRKDVPDDETEHVPTNGDYYLCKAFVFRGDQVTKIEERREDKMG